MYVTFIKYLFTQFLYHIFIHFICFIINMLLIIYDIIIMSIGMDTTSILKKIIQLKKVSV